MSNNQDDSIIANQSSIDRGLFRADTFKKYHSEIKKNPSTSEDDLFIKPDSNKVIDMKHGNYSKLNEYKELTFFGQCSCVEWSLSTPEVRGSNPVIGKLLYRTFLYCQLLRKDENKEKEVENGPFKKEMAFFKCNLLP